MGMCEISWYYDDNKNTICVKLLCLTPLYVKKNNKCTCTQRKRYLFKKKRKKINMYQNTKKIQMYNHVLVHEYDTSKKVIVS